MQDQELDCDPCMCRRVNGFMKTTRILAAALAVLAAACSYEPTTSTVAGTSRILLTDDPFPYTRIAQVNIHVVRIQTAPVPDSVNANWTTVAAPDSTINILDLQAGQTTSLGELNLDATTIGAVRVVINTALSSVVDTAGNPVAVHWPVYGEMPINAYVQASLANMAPGTPHNLVIDFDVGRSFEDLSHDGSLFFLSWVRVLDDAGAGAVAGVVTGPSDTAGTMRPLRNAAVTVLQGDSALSAGTWFKIATGRTDAAGHYRVAFVLAGTYIVRVEPLGVPTAGCVDKRGIVIPSGGTTTLDVALPGAPGTCSQTTGGGGGPDTNGTTIDSVVAYVNISAIPSSPAVGDSVGVYAQITNAVGQALYGKPVTWVVSDTTVLGITFQMGQNLLLKAKKPGTATITATSQGVAGQRTVTVQ